MSYKVPVLPKLNRFSAEIRCQTAMTSILSSLFFRLDHQTCQKLNERCLFSHFGSSPSAENKHFCIDKMCYFDFCSFHDRALYRAEWIEFRFYLNVWGGSNLKIRWQIQNQFQIEMDPVSPENMEMSFQLRL